MDRSEPDNPSPPAREPDAAGAPNRQRRVWWKLALPVITVAVLVGVGLVGFELVYSRSSGSAGPNVSPGALGSDGIPNQIDGQHVYRVSSNAEWGKLSGSFLLGGYVFQEMANCPAQLQPPPSPEAALIPPCGGLGLAPTAGLDATNGGLKVASLGSMALDGWLHGSAIVVRVHTHDPEAAQCGAGGLAECKAALVVEGVVWPTVPTEIDGQRVYRATDQASFASLKSSFLLGGLVTWPDVVPPCPSEAGPPGDGQGLLPYCYWPSIDGLALSPRGSFDEPDNEIVVARVHVNDPLAAQCQPSVQAECQAAIVVESVVWRSNPYQAATPTPGVASPNLSANPVSIPDTGPATSSISAGAAASMAISQAGSTIPVTVVSTRSLRA